MIQFRCSSCGKKYLVAETRIGELLTCSCKQDLKVPRRSGKSAKYRTWSALFIEMLVYGTGGAMLGFLFGIVLVSQLYTFRTGKYVIVLLTMTGLFIGTLGGERGINWIGSKIRDRENQ